jgi:hypothetical protein
MLFKSTFMKFEAFTLNRAAVFLGSFFLVYLFLQFFFVCMLISLTIINNQGNVNDDQKLK